MGKVGKGLLAASLVTGLAATAWAGGKNLQHYPKDMSMEDLKTEMKVLTRSVGAEGCDYCHQYKPKRDFTVDTDLKKVARAMLGMTDKINHDLFTKEALGIKEGEVPVATCYMCHKGKQKPEVEPKKQDDNKKFIAEVGSPKHAEMAANMKKMTERLNKEVFTWKDAPKATCWMCHRGELEIKTKLPGGGERGDK